MAIAAINGDREILKLLIREGLDVNELSEGVQPLYVATYYDHPQASEDLIQYGADVNFQNHEGYCINIAAEKGYTQLCSQLLKAGADINHENK